MKLQTIIYIYFCIENLSLSKLFNIEEGSDEETPEIAGVDSNHKYVDYLSTKEAIYDEKRIHKKVKKDNKLGLSSAKLRFSCANQLSSCNPCNC